MVSLATCGPVTPVSVRHAGSAVRYAAIRASRLIEVIQIEQPTTLATTVLQHGQGERQMSPIAGSTSSSSSWNFKTASGSDSNPGRRVSAAGESSE